jgi:hypothetical protein
MEMGLVIAEELHPVFLLQHLEAAEGRTGIRRDCLVLVAAVQVPHRLQADLALPGRVLQAEMYLVPLAVLEEVVGATRTV